jgi:hypothetical protein
MPAIVMSRTVRDRRVRASVWVLALVVWLAPSLQVFAMTLAEAHCLEHGHSALDSGPPAHAAMHEHHQHEGAPGDHSARSNGGHDTAHCACPCGLACTAAMALLPALPAAEFSAPERAAALDVSLHTHAIHAVPQRPPTSRTPIA